MLQRERRSQQECFCVQGSSAGGGGGQMQWVVEVVEKSDLRREQHADPD